MTPNAIEILIHCHVSPFPHPRKYAPAVEDELHDLEKNGLIEPEPGSEGSYRTTDRGRAHIHQLCQLEWPIQAWVDKSGKVISL